MALSRRGTAGEAGITDSRGHDPFLPDDGNSNLVFIGIPLAAGRTLIIFRNITFVSV